MRTCWSIVEGWASRYCPITTNLSYLLNAGIVSRIFLQTSSNTRNSEKINLLFKVSRSTWIIYFQKNNIYSFCWTFKQIDSIVEGYIHINKSVMIKALITTVWIETCAILLQITTSLRWRSLLYIFARHSLAIGTRRFNFIVFTLTEL